MVQLPYWSKVPKALITIDSTETGEYPSYNLLASSVLIYTDGQFDGFNLD